MQTLACRVFDDDHAQARVLDDEAKPFGWIARIERNVRPTCLQHGQDCGDQPRRAIETDPDQGFRPDAGGAQAPGEGICPPVQLVVRDLLIRERDRNRVRALCGDLLEAFVKRRGRVVLSRPEAVAEQALDFSVREHPQVREALRRVARRAIKQHLEVLEQPLDGRRMKPVAVESRQQCQTIQPVLERQQQVERRRSGIDGHRRHRQAR